MYFFVVGVKPANFLNIIIKFTPYVSGDNFTENMGMLHCYSWIDNVIISTSFGQFLDINIRALRSAASDRRAGKSRSELCCKSLSYFLSLLLCAASRSGALRNVRRYGGIILKFACFIYQMLTYVVQYIMILVLGSLQSK